MSVSWSELDAQRRVIRQRWGRVGWLPRIPRARAHVAAAVANMAADARVLDVGASDGAFGQRLPASVRYERFDIDPAVDAEYRSVADLPPTTFDCAVCFEVIEHLTLPDVIALFDGVHRALRPGAKFFLSTPNVHHPTAVHSSATHMTPFPYDELGGLLVLRGFAVQALHRCHKDSVLKAVLRAAVAPLYRTFGLDPARSILVTAQRPA